MPQRHAFHIEPGGPETLTPSEGRALEAYGRLGSWHRVAAETGLSQQTLKNESLTAKRKLGVETIVQAVVIYDRWVRDGMKSWPHVERRSGRDRRQQRVARLPDDGK